MKLDVFVKNFADQFEETDLKSIKATTKFRDLEEWTSLTAMSIIAMVDEKYEVKLTGEDIRTSHTIEDIYKIIISRK